MNHWGHGEHWASGAGGWRRDCLLWDLLARLWRAEFFPVIPLFPVVQKQARDATDASG
jgi:hypothetical protein